MNSLNASRCSLLVAVALSLLAACEQKAAPAAEEDAGGPVYRTPLPVVVYSSAGTAQIGPVVDAFTADTGIKVHLLVDDYRKLAAKLENHGRDPVADLFVGASLAHLSSAAENDLLRPTYSDADSLNRSGPLYDPDKTWFPLGVRARPIIYNTAHVDQSELASLDSYAALGNSAWQGRLCLSSSRIPGNRLLIALLISKYGEKEAELIVRGWRRNMIDNLYRDDTALLQAVASGECHIAIADTGVLATFTGPGRNAPLAPLRFGGAATMQVDISGAAVNRHAGNPEGAEVLLRWLSSATPNSLFASGGNEFPVNESAVTIAPIASWADLVADPLALSGLGFLQEDAAKLAERAHYP